ncbi:MAG TPA: tetratricopeptide repeat protein, partial [Humisphaera sp.]
AEAHYNLGVALGLAGQPRDALAAYRKAVALKPGEPLFQYNLGITLKDAGMPREAADAFRRAIGLRPDYPEAYNNLGVALKDAGLHAESAAALRQAVALRPGYADAHSNLLMGLHYAAATTPAELAAEHARWDRQHAAPLAARARPHANDRDPDRRLRVGYVSGDLWNHPVARFLTPLLANHDPARVEVFAYANVARPDGVTEMIRRRCHAWRDVHGVDDDAVAAQIRDDRIDVLVDLSLHTAGNRLLVFARRPAPVQVTWLGYAGGTGMAAIDWRVTDPHLDPEPGPDDGPAAAAGGPPPPERPLRLPHCFWCYDPVLEAGGVLPLRALETGQVTFACLNNFAKVGEPVQELWAAVLNAVPDSRLLIHSPLGPHRQHVLARFARLGVAEDRVEFAGRMPIHDYFRTYRKVDVALDPFPFGGGTTTCDALWMGVPVVTLRGSTPVARAGASILTNAGLADWVADTPADYVRLAARWADDLPSLAMLRASMRDRLRASPLMDGRRFARDMEAALRAAWRAWATGTPEPAAVGASGGTA